MVYVLVCDVMIIHFFLACLSSSSLVSSDLVCSRCLCMVDLRCRARGSRAGEAGSSDFGHYIVGQVYGAAVFLNDC